VPPGKDSLPEETRAALAAGARLFDAGRFFDAHEVWEDAWRVEVGARRKLALQGLIQIAAGFHKGLVQGRPSGMVRLLDAGLGRLEASGGIEGLDLTAFLAEVVAWREGAGRWAEGGERPGMQVPRLG
jgi:predicted metal-dependent hydrolase